MSISVCADEPVDATGLVPDKNDLKNIVKFLKGKKTKTINEKIKAKIIFKVVPPKELTYLSFSIKRKQLKCVKKVIVKVGNVSIN